MSTQWEISMCLPTGTRTRQPDPIKKARSRHGMQLYRVYRFRCLVSFATLPLIHPSTGRSEGSNTLRVLYRSYSTMQVSQWSATARRHQSKSRDSRSGPAYHRLRELPRVHLEYIDVISFLPISAAWSVKSQTTPLTLSVASMLRKKLPWLASFHSRQSSGPSSPFSR